MTTKIHARLQITQNLTFIYGILIDKLANLKTYLEDTFYARFIYCTICYAAFSVLFEKNQKKDHALALTIKCYMLSLFTTDI